MSRYTAGSTYSIYLYGESPQAKLQTLSCHDVFMYRRPKKNESAHSRKTILQQIMYEGSAEWEHTAANAKRKRSLYMHYSGRMCEQTNKLKAVNMQCFP